jgi:hypothetical protein
MEAESLVFTAKDVIGMILLAVSVLGAYFALKKDVEKAVTKIKELDVQLLHKETILLLIRSFILLNELLPERSKYLFR